MFLFACQIRISPVHASSEVKHLLQQQETTLKSLVDQKLQKQEATLKSLVDMVDQKFQESEVTLKSSVNQMFQQLEHILKGLYLVDHSTLSDLHIFLV